jgi:hypothetical protein
MHLLVTDTQIPPDPGTVPGFRRSPVKEPFPSGSGFADPQGADGFGELAGTSGAAVELRYLSCK